MHTNKAKHSLRLVRTTLPAAVAGAPATDASADPTTLDYYRRIESYANKIRGTEDLSAIISILEKALAETHALNDAATTRVAPARLADAEHQIDALKKELEETRTLIHFDHLTGALNRGGLDAAYMREAARADRHAAPLGAALIDIDNFKLLNDRYGHPAGDAALVHFARMIKMTIRPSDVVGRFGGEEFLCLLPDSGSQQTAHALARLQNAMHQSPLIYKNDPLPITFSAGIAVRKIGETREAMISRADRALYQAKGAGKNRAVTAD
jgi:diguanylate cyclase